MPLPHGQAMWVLAPEASLGAFCLLASCNPRRGWGETRPGGQGGQGGQGGLGRLMGPSPIRAAGQRYRSCLPEASRGERRLGGGAAAEHTCGVRGR